MKGKVLKLIILTMVIFLFPQNAIINAEDITHYKVNGKDLYYNDSMIFNGRTYIPVRDFSELLGANVAWNSEKKEVDLKRQDLEIKLYPNERRVIYNNQIYYMDTPVLLKNGVTYAPVRFIAEAFYHNVSWDKNSKTIYIQEKATYVVRDGDSLASISGQYNIPIESLLAWNNLTSEELYPNMKLKIEPVELKAIDELKTKAVISYQDPELDLLARIIYSEARDEPYDGLVAVAAVVINRVESPNFPNTIYDVIYQPGQFTPVTTGKINEIIPNEQSYRAAKEALVGADPVNGALYFYNPSISNSSFFLQKSHVKTIGNHSFYK